MAFFCENMEFTVTDVSGWPEVIHQILKKFSLSRKFLLIGDLGAGKTTFTKSFLECLGGRSTDVSSPTFSLINQYTSALGPVYHLDLYRLESLDEALDIGIEDYLFDEHFALIEWPQVIEPLLEPGMVYLKLAKEEGERRTLKVKSIQ